MSTAVQSANTTQSNQYNFFSYAPRDVFIKILCYLRSLNDARSAGQVNKRFYTEIFKSDASLLWANLCKNRFPRAYQRFQNSENIDYRELCHYKSVEEKTMYARCPTQQVVSLKLPATAFDFSSINQFLLLPNNCFFACSKRGVACIWDHQGHVLNTFNIDIPQFEAHVGENHIHLYSEKSNALQTYDLKGNLVQEPVMFRNVPRSSHIKICGSTAVRGSKTAQIEISDCKTGDFLKEIQGPTVPNTSVRCVDMNERYIVAGIRNKTLKKCTVQIWDRDGVFLKELQLDMKRMISIRIQGDRLLIHSRDLHSINSPLHVWSLDTFEKLGETPPIRCFDANDDYHVTLSHTISPQSRDPFEALVEIWDLGDIKEQPIFTFTDKRIINHVYIRGSSSIYIIYHYSFGQIELLDFSPPPMLQNILCPAPQQGSLRDELETKEITTNIG
jgi:hypothetical protein